MKDGACKRDIWKVGGVAWCRRAHWPASQIHVADSGRSASFVHRIDVFSVPFVTSAVSVISREIINSANSGPGIAYYFQANVRATSQHTFERSCGHSKVCCVVALKHSRESNRPVPGPKPAGEKVKAAYYVTFFFTRWYVPFLPARVTVDDNGGVVGIGMQTSIRLVFYVMIK